MQYWAQQVRPCEEHEPIPDYPPRILGEGENELMPPALIDKIKASRAPQQESQKQD